MDRLTELGRQIGAVGRLALLAPFSPMLRRQIAWQADEEQAEAHLRAVCTGADLVDAFRAVGTIEAVFTRFRQETIRGHFYDERDGTPRRAALRLVTHHVAMTGYPPTETEVGRMLVVPLEERVREQIREWGAAMTPEQIREWRKIANDHEGRSGTVHMPRGLLRELLDCIPEASVEAGLGIADDALHVGFEQREGRLTYTVGVPVMACEILGARDELVSGSEVTMTDAAQTYPELVGALRLMALRVAVSAIRMGPE